MLKKISVLLFIVLLGYSCTQSTEEQLVVFNKALSKHRIIRVEKTNLNTTSIGIFTKNNYGTTHTFRYSFTLNGNDVRWNGGSSEPKSILFSGDEVYIRYLKNKQMVVSETDTITNQNVSHNYSEIVAGYEQYVDERFFFKLFGDDYWITIDSSEYENNKVKGTEYPIPNDNEYVIKNENVLLP